MADLQKSSPKLNSLWGEIFSSPHRINMGEHDILVLKPSPCLHDGNEVYDWMGLEEWNSWFKSQVRDWRQDIVNLKTIENYRRNSPMSIKFQ
ncbi:uncharacterized protein TNCV_1859691 [Trichonephila clavipes]|nr:uncharacterized protein TNCV_1859691 [Trichonephila clavipes]